MATTRPALGEPPVATEPGMPREKLWAPDSSATPAPESKAAPRKTGFMTTLRDEIDPSHSDVPVLATCFVSGLCDSVAFNASSVFVSMQTGNTIFLALGTAKLPYAAQTLWLRALVSIVSFWAGCFFFGQSRRVGAKGKATLAASFLVQSTCILAAAAAAQSGAAPAFAMRSLGTAAAHEKLAGYEASRMTLLPVALLAFQFGGQIVTSRVLGFNEVPTNVLTSLYCDLFSDPLLAKPLGKNVKRDRRVVAVLLMVAGGILGAWVQRSEAGMPAALWLGGAIKMAIAVSWLSWKGKKVDCDEKVP